MTKSKCIANNMNNETFKVKTKSKPIENYKNKTKAL